MIIKNISDHDFEFSWEFNTYFIPKNKIVEVSKELGEFIKSRWERSFSFDLEVTKGVTPIESKPSKSYIKREEKPDQGLPTMQTSFGYEKANFGIVDQTPKSGTIDKDGVGWYGEGLVME